MPTNTVQDRALLAGISRLKAGLQRVLTWFQGSTALGTPGQFTNIQLGTNLTGTPSGDTLVIDATGGGGGSGTVTNVSVGDLSPLFTANVTNPTTTPAVAFTAVNEAANLFYAGPTSGGAAAPDFRAIVSADLPVNNTKRGPGCIFSNGGLALTGTLTSEVEVPYGCTITGWTIVGDVAGTASIAVSHATYANYDTMTSLFTATVTTAKKSQATGLTNTIAAGDIVRFSATGFALFTRVSIVLDVTLT